MARLQHKIPFGSLPRDLDRDAALVDLREPEHTRSDIVLTEDVTRKLDRLVLEYQSREALALHGVTPKTRLLFVGPPGCGKTLCAEVLANDLGLPLLYARFDGIVSSYLGETASNLRRVFNYAGQRLSVLFFDEFDALGKKRDDPQEIGELKRVVSSFLQILDSYSREHFVIAATNHEGLLDEALWRRFDEIVHLGKPTSDQLVQLMDMRLRSVRKRDINLPTVVAGMRAFSFADAERVCHEAIKTMVLSQKKELTQDLLEVEVAEQCGRMAVASGAAIPAR